MLWYDGVERPYSAQPDNWKAFFPDGNVNQHNVSLSGGGEYGTVRLSYTRDDSKANIPNSKYSTNTFNLGSSIKVSKMLTADVSASYISYYRLNTPPVGSGNYLAGMSYAATRDYRSDVEKTNNFTPQGSRRDVTNSSNFPLVLRLILIIPTWPTVGGTLKRIILNYAATNYWVACALQRT